MPSRMTVNFSARRDAERDEVVAHLGADRDERGRDARERTARARGRRASGTGRSSRAARGRGTCARRSAAARRPRAAPRAGRPRRPSRCACAGCAAARARISRASRDTASRSRTRRDLAVQVAERHDVDARAPRRRTTIELLAARERSRRRASSRSRASARPCGQVGDVQRRPAHVQAGDHAQDRDRLSQGAASAVRRRPSSSADRRLVAEHLARGRDVGPRVADVAGARRREAASRPACRGSAPIVVRDVVHARGRAGGDVEDPAARARRRRAARIVAVDDVVDVGEVARLLAVAVDRDRLARRRSR